jgi:hypothetical protein
LLHKKKVYKIKALPGGNPCTVLQVSESEPLLANLEKQFGLVEVKSIDNSVYFIHFQTIYNYLQMLISIQASSGKQPLGLEMADIGTSSKQSVGLDCLELSSKDTSMVAVVSPYIIYIFLYLIYHIQQYLKK